MLTSSRLIDIINSGDIMELQYSQMGKRISNRRKQLGISQISLAEKLDISNNHLSGVERGKEIPSLDLLVDICNALDVTPDYLLMGSMHSDNISQNIIESLRLCSNDDLQLVKEIVQLMVDRNSSKWNDDNFA